ncbi:MAG: carboxypeptidase regulatory-like domain-containing protein [Acidobacteria bacterium]|nr:carboxypeptidase regulatory-like domain-containing protein [Acidobacteriota bacterium]
MQSQNTTAAMVSISGRVLARDGSGVRGATVTITDSAGAARTVLTNAFGYYQFSSVAVGATYVLGAVARRYAFHSRTVSVSDSLSNVDFIDGQ